MIELAAQALAAKKKKGELQHDIRSERKDPSIKMYVRSCDCCVGVRFWEKEPLNDRFLTVSLRVARTVEANFVLGHLQETRKVQVWRREERVRGTHRSRTHVR